MKRHTRPYGCTESSCTKSFGSKNDWKRHENSQHFRVEAWKCAEGRLSTLNGNTAFIRNKSKTDPSRPPPKVHDKSKNKHRCNRVFYRREQFQSHLEVDHRIKEQDKVSEKCKEQRVGRNGQKAFWCGFCQAIVPLQERGLKAWDERFTHIDEKHFKNGENVDSWFPMDKDIPKSALAEEKKEDSDEEKNESDEENWSDKEDEDEPRHQTSPTTEPVPVIVDDDQRLPEPSMEPQSGPSPLQPGKIWYCVSL